MKNLVIAGVIGLVFMAGSFWFGLRLAPAPPPRAKEASVHEQAQNTAPSKPDPIGLETLKKTSETMMTLNQTLQVREQNVAAREQKAKQREDELNAERAALDRSHEKFKLLFGEFQQRLQLVEASQLDQLQKQAGLYNAMGTTQSIELVRAMDDLSMTRLFSVMDVKPLAKLVAEWKTKYPDDTPRLLQALDGMAQVMPKEKIALSIPTTAPDSASPGSLTPSANQAPDPSAPDATPNPTPASGSSSAPAPAVSTPTPALTPPPDSTPAPVSTAAAN
jgi:hypothetical protein